MNVSYAWLASYFYPGEAPAPEAIPDMLNFHSFEVESAEQLPDGDTLFDVKVLPNRGHDALSFWSIAWELATISGKKLDTAFFSKKIETFLAERSADLLSLSVEDSELVPRALKRVVQIKVQESPEWLKKRLASIGQRSINAVVDATNYLTQELGQPVHAFDYDKLSGSGKKQIQIRHALPGEKVTTLDGKTFELEPWMLVIADGEKALDIAGIKGGNNSGIDKNTTRVVLSACTFDGSTIRRTSQKLGLRTDASTHFQHGLSPHLAEVGMKRLTQLVVDLANGIPTEDVIDVYPAPQVPRSITVSQKEVEKILGLAITGTEIESVLNRIGLAWKPGAAADTYVVEAPPTRLDLEDVPDIVEEIGRFYGYEHVVPVLPDYSAQRPEVLKSYFYSERVRETLVAKGFSELYLYSITEAGERELENPLAESKNKMRTSLAPGLAERLEFNVRNKDILGLDRVLLFEIGNVYPRSGERMRVALASSDKKMNLADCLPWQVKNLYSGPLNIVEFDFTELLATLPEAGSYAELSPQRQSTATYAEYSPFPFSARDVAVFVPTDITAEMVMQLIDKEKGALCVRGPWLFDTFTKTFPDGTQKTSYGFRLVFQAADRNLTGEEVQATMDAITKALNLNEGWKVR